MHVDLGDVEYVYVLGNGTDHYSVNAALLLLALPGYRHAEELLAKGATPVATTIDGHYVLALGDETWIVAEPRASGRVERHMLDWRELVVRVQRNEPISDVIGWDED